ncbi:uncharacterized protein N0V89_001313 [Didymosphaeria variabile]|uniref:Putative gamma-glutamylcyclotransferase n=1 Tax=Didymosphaeria variabile TaxID=1932322 RepID=A0A9W8XWZ7_9PLEO|nr:uncharacterized protein N0V89_001313 [Didymosphaeria variabile]KAJ4360746.1 hypothetical protein N0V89_001313 [Didymosphaeria variabile]
MSDLIDLAVLEGMAHTATESSVLASNYADYGGQDLWMKLFCYTAPEAEAAIEAHFGDVEREVINDEQFERIRTFSDLKDHDKESFAYYLKRSDTTLARYLLQQAEGLDTKRRDKGQKYLVKLGRGLTAAFIQRLAGLAEPPGVSESETGETMAAVVDSKTKAALEEALPGLLQFVPISGPRKAEKSLSSCSIAPALGIDATLPQHRPTMSPSPGQDSYPVPYFFYGSLADPEKLSRVLEVKSKPVLSPAEIRGGRLMIWGEYFALVDGTEQDFVSGWVYVVESQAHEDKLRWYETGKYEVVRCEVWRGGKKGPGLTFRFCGKKEELA